VGSLEGTGHLHPESQGFIQWEWPVAADPRVEGVLGVVRHDDVRPTVVGDADVEDIDDIRVPGQPARRALLADESFPVLLDEVCGEDLDCHGAVERRLGAAVDDAETAAADLVCVLESGGCQIGRDRTRRAALRREGIVVGHRPDRFFRSEPLSKKCTTAGLSRRYSRISPTGPRPMLDLRPTQAEFSGCVPGRWCYAQLNTRPILPEASHSRTRPAGSPG